MIHQGLKFKKYWSSLKLQFYREGKNWVSEKGDNVTKASQAFLAKWRLGFRGAGLQHSIIPPILHKKTFPLAFQTLGEIQPSLRTRLLSSLQQEADATANY